MSSYSYDERQGLYPVSWDQFFALTKGLAQALAEYHPEEILGIMRGGLYPAALLSHLLQVDMTPIRLTRRENDRVVRDHPTWLIFPPERIWGKRILIVDEICDSGETLQLAVEASRQAGAAEVRTAVLYSHKRAMHLPDYVGIVTDSLVLNPWDREIWQAGQFVAHPEYQQALEQQGRSASELATLGIPPRAPDKVKA